MRWQSASATGFFPNEQREVLRGRAKLCETLAISGTAMASSGSFDDLKVTLQSVLNRDPTIQSLGLRRASGELLVTAGAHDKYWDTEDRQSDPGTKAYVDNNTEAGGPAFMASRTSSSVIPRAMICSLTILALAVE